MDLEGELENIVQYIGKDTNKFEEYYLYLREQFNSKEEHKRINEYILMKLKESGKETDRKIDDIEKMIQKK